MLNQAIALLVFYPALLFSQDYIVTAKKIVTPLDSTLSNTDLYNNSIDQDGPLNSLQNTYSAENSFYSTQNGAFGSSGNFYLRGLDSSFTKILINDIELKDPSTPFQNFPGQLFPTGLYSHSELIRGTQSTLYGTESVSGILKLHSHNQKNENLIMFGGGSFSTWINTINIHRYQKNNYNLSLDTSYLKSEGISSYNNGSENDPFEQAAFNFYLTKFFTHSDLSFGALYLDSKQEIDSFGSDLVDNDQSTTRNKGISLAYSYYFDHFDLKFSQFYLKNQRKDSEPSPGYYDSHTLKSDLQIQAYQNSYITHLFGIDYENNYANTSNGFDNLSDKKNENSSIYYNNQIKLTPYLLELGLREEQNQSFNNFTSYHLGLGYNLSQNTLLSANYSRGFKSPTLYELYSPSYGNSELQPTEAFTYDINLKQKFENWEFKISYFNTALKNRIEFNQISNTDFQYLNTGRTKIYGWEPQITYQKGLWKYQSSYTETSGENTETGEQLLKVPSKLWKNLIEFSPRENSFVSLISRYVGSRYDYGMVHMPSYHILDSRYSYKNGRYRYNLNFENLLNKKYQDSASYGTKGLGLYGTIEISI
ncbi:MAG: TonB-dependent receptor [Halobacteriovoraceae bacterium]|nr:TonB-dependent receptor [Halobacteriovoraceae bacterium]